MMLSFVGTKANFLAFSDCRTFCSCFLCFAMGAEEADSADVEFDFGMSLFRQYFCCMYLLSWGACPLAPSDFLILFARRFARRLTFVGTFVHISPSRFETLAESSSGFDCEIEWRASSSFRCALALVHPNLLVEVLHWQNVINIQLRFHLDVGKLSLRRKT